MKRIFSSSPPGHGTDFVSVRMLLQHLHSARNQGSPISILLSDSQAPSHLYALISRPPQTFIDTGFLLHISLPEAWGTVIWPSSNTTIVISERDVIAQCNEVVSSKTVPRREFGFM